ncbi:MAG TPA: helix-turn-helix domain-containing protein [Verrucomicrobiae bacterium]|jgi:hemolysin activation/secretion protein/AraC-like DNA-binding protein
MLKFERTVVSGAEWQPETQDWLVLQLTEGIAYAFDRNGNKELPPEGVIVCPPNAGLTITASVLGRAVFLGVSIRISSLIGLLTALERLCLEVEVARQFAPYAAVPAEHPLAKRAAQLFARDQAMTMSTRLGFAHAFAELVGPPLTEAIGKRKENEQGRQDAKGRLQQFLSQIPESEISNLSLEELSKMLHCCERHASRLFREEFGVGFLAYVSELRLKKACQLLLESDLKVIDVALQSGHGSLSHFNSVFKRRFHLTPTQWREQQAAPPRRPMRVRPLQIAAMVVWMLLSFAGAFASSAVDATGKATATAPAPAPLKFKVDRYEVLGNTVLSTNIISRVLAPYTGDAVDISTVTNAMAKLQMEYFQRGFVTVKVTAPPQQVTNRVIVFQATEGRVTTVKVVHNHYFSSNNVIAALPYVQTLQSGDRILNGKIFQTELDRANSNPDRQVSPEVRPGLEPGTTGLILDVKDRLPLHGRLEFNNYSPPGSPQLRVNANVSYSDLWQLDHTLGLQYGFSPESMKPSMDGAHVLLSPVDTPNVTYYSGFYRAPLGPPDAIESQIAQDPNHFGYNEATKQFVMPPNIGRAEFTAYASRSTTAPTIHGPTSPVGNTGQTNGLLTITQQLISQQYTSQTTAGGRFSFPLPVWKDIQSSWSFGFDYKEDKVVTLPTNYFYETTIITHGLGSSTPPTITTTTTPVPGTGTTPSLNYVPLFIGWSGMRQDHWLQGKSPGDIWNEFDGSLSAVIGTGGIFSEHKNFPVLIANSYEANSDFVAVRPQISRIQILPDNFTLFLNMSGQWANEPLINLEQFSLGGNGSVRGYREGELFSDTGWVGQLELRTPVYWRGNNRRVGTQLTVFMDYGQGFAVDAASYHPFNDSLWGAGAGVNFNLGPHVESHVMVAWPLLNSEYSIAGHARLEFSLSAQL